MTAAARTRVVAAIDQGTTSTRCIVFDHGGRLISVAQRLHRQYYPRPGWVEHDADDIWNLVRVLLPEALREAGVQPDAVVALGITNQRETVVLWDRRTGRPVHRAICWQDTRTESLLSTIAAEIDPRELQLRTGLPLTSYVTGPKLRWILSEHPDLADRAAAGELLAGTMDTWVLWNLTGGPDGGVHATDPTNASRTMLMNLATLDWDEELLACMRVPRGLLPEIRPTLSAFGTTSVPVPGIAVTTLIGDQQASLFGQTALEPGSAKCTFGTGSFVLLNTGNRLVRSTHGLISTVAYTTASEHPVYALEGPIAASGALVRWCRDSLGIIRSIPEVETMARDVADNGGCYLVPAFSGLYAPHWNGGARGVFVGLTHFTSRGHLARAVLEATAWQVRDVADAVAADGAGPIEMLLVDGGMTANNLLMQMVADVLDVRVVRPMMTETVALGAAYAAGLTAGYWPDRRVLRDNWLRAAEWTPMIDPARRERELREWRHAVRTAIAWGEPNGVTPRPREQPVGGE